jgi:phosphatidylinositol-3-phosphatase
MTPARGDDPSILRCGDCGSPLAHDQRYCVNCGTRRAALPAHAAGLFAGIIERGRRVATPSRPDGESLVPQTHWYDSWVQAPRAAAVAVLSMLGFGVVVGSLVTGSAASVFQPVIVAVAPGSHNADQVGAGGGGSGGSDSGGGGVETITVNSGGGGSSSGGGGGGSVGGGTGGGGTSTPGGLSPIGNAPPIKHVFMVMLSDQGFNQTFGHSKSDPYLAKTLVQQGELVQNYYAVAGGSLANEIALISGQGPTPNTNSDCPIFTDVVPGDSGSSGQVLGTGCVYPKGTGTLADQVTAAGLKWKAYVQTKPTGKAAAAEACRHPRIGAHDPVLPSPADPYVTWRNPFLYFQSLQAPASCSKTDVPLTQLATDLKSTSTTPTLSYIVADACGDGSDTPCAPHAKAGPATADTFLKSVIPKIMHSAAYKADGLITITYDQAPQTGPYADSSSCCGTPDYPNLIGFTGISSGPTGPAGTSGASGPTGPSSSPSLGNGQTNPTGGGGQVGLLLLSKYVSPGVPEVTDYYNHFSLLASIEDSFGFKRLGYAGAKSLPVFGSGVWSAFGSGGF